MSENKELIEKVLKKGPQDIAFEPLPGENHSPLAQPVVEKNDTSNQAKTSGTETNTATSTAENKSQSKSGEKTTEAPKVEIKKEPMDAPEQEIGADPGANTISSSLTKQDEPEFTIPLAQAGMMADTVLGVVNNTVLEVGAGYFITISKHKDFYDFDSVIQLIDEQNVKNIKRIKLDEEDKAMLRPLLIYVIRKKTKVMSPENQLLGVALSIIIKKAKVVLEMRAENEKLVDRIRDNIRMELRAAKEDLEKEKEEQEFKSEQEEIKIKQDFAEDVYQETVVQPKVNKTGLPGSVLETT